jgi:MATE family multidrug resistance protein
MFLRPSTVKPELGPMLRLAVPVVLAELGWMAMGVVDAMMVGRLGAEALGAVGLGRAVFLFVAVFGIGLLLGLDTLVSQSFGAGDLADCRHSLVQGVYLALLLAVPLMLLVRVGARLLGPWGIDAEVLPLAVDYVKAVGWAMLPLLLYAASRRYLQAINLVRPVMIALVSANAVNVAGNWILIYGNLGAPALGAEGAGWATVLSNTYMASFLLVTAVVRARELGVRRADVPLGIDRARLARLLALGLPAASQLLVEIGVFVLATALVGRLDASSLAAHQIALIAASVTFMVPLGLSSAGAVRVGQALGRDDPAGAARAGWTALLLGACFMLLAATVFITLPGPLIRVFTTDARVVVVGITLLHIAAVFQLFDGLQVVATGTLRGAGDTRTPLIWNLVGYWLLGLPVGYHLCFNAGHGAAGLWVGLSVGLIVVGAVLLVVWARRSLR